jgi:hypothetical protein
MGCRIGCQPMCPRLSLTHVCVWLASWSTVCWCGCGCGCGCGWGRLAAVAPLVACVQGFCAWFVALRPMADELCAAVAVAAPVPGTATAAAGPLPTLLLDCAAVLKALVSYHGDVVVTGLLPSLIGVAPAATLALTTGCMAWMLALTGAHTLGCADVLMETWSVVLSLVPTASEDVRVRALAADRACPRVHACLTRVFSRVLAQPHPPCGCLGCRMCCVPWCPRCWSGWFL